MPQKATAGLAWATRAVKFSARKEVLWVSVYSLMRTQSLGVPTSPLMFSARSVQVVTLVMLLYSSTFPQQKRQSKLVAPQASVIPSRRQSVSAQVPTQPTPKRMTTAQWLRAMEVQFLKRQSLLAYWPEKVQLEQVMGVGEEEVNPARLMVGELGSSSATSVRWGAREQGVAEDQLALMLKMLLAHTMQPAAVSLKQGPLQSMQEAAQKWLDVRTLRNTSKRHAFSAKCMRDQLQMNYNSNIFPLRKTHYYHQYRPNPTQSPKQNQSHHLDRMILQEASPTPALALLVEDRTRRSSDYIFEFSSCFGEKKGEV